MSKKHKVAFWMGKLLGFVLLAPIFFCEFGVDIGSYALDGFYDAIRKLPGMRDYTCR